MNSQAQFGNTSHSSTTVTKSAMPESQKFDGPAGINTPGVQDKFAANSGKPLAKPGFSD